MEFQLHYTEQGQGTLYCYTETEKVRITFSSIEHFSKKYRVIAVDTRGMENLKGSNSFTLAQFVEDLKQLLDYLN